MADNTENGIFVNREKKRPSHDIVNAPTVVDIVYRRSGKATNLNTDSS